MLLIFAEALKFSSFNLNQMKMTSQKFLRTTGLVLVMSFLMLGLTGCEWWASFTNLFGGSMSNFEKASISSKNLMLEDFMPTDSWMVGAFNTLNVKEKAELVSLLQLFPPIEGNEIWTSVQKGDFFGVFEELLESEGIDYMDEIKPILGENYRLAVGMAGLDVEGAPGMYFGVTVKDAKKFEDLVRRERSGEFKVTEYKRGKMLVFDEMTILIYGDVVLFTSRVEYAKSSIDRASKKSGLRHTLDYQKCVSELKSPYLAYFYMNMEVLMEQMLNSGDFEDEDFQALMDANPMMGVVETEGIVVLAEEDGLRIQGVVVGDKVKMKEKAVDFNDYASGEAYLMDLVPGEGMIFYSEGSRCLVAKMVQPFSDDLDADKELMFP